MEETTQFVLSKDFIQKAKANSIDIANNKESYDEYFKMGGTVGKMTVVTAHRYALHIERRVEERENE